MFENFDNMNFVQALEKLLEMNTSIAISKEENFDFEMRFGHLKQYADIVDSNTNTEISETEEFWSAKEEFIKKYGNEKD